MPNHKLMYTFRGWIAFVAFMDMGTAVRCYIEKRTFLGDGLYMSEEATLPRILGAYSVLKALILIHCTLFIHYKPIISLGVSCLLLTILLYISESLYYGTAVFGFYVLFPCVLNILYVGTFIYWSLCNALIACNIIMSRNCERKEKSSLNFIKLPASLIYVNSLTAIGLIITPRFLEPPIVIEDENTELLRHVVAFRRKRGKKNN